MNIVDKGSLLGENVEIVGHSGGIVVEIPTIRNGIYLWLNLYSHETYLRSLQNIVKLLSFLGLEHNMFEKTEYNTYREICEAWGIVPNDNKCGYCEKFKSWLR